MNYSTDNPPPFMAKWKNDVEGGQTPAHIAQNCYAKDARLKGTIAENFVEGYEKIRAYFVKFTDGKNEARIEFETIEFDKAKGFFTGNYTFRWKDNDGTDHSLPAIYEFTPTQLDAPDARIARHYSHPRQEL